MKTFPVTSFKAHVLAILDGVATTGEQVLVTKRGKPVARVVPYHEPNAKPIPGRLAGTLMFEKDIVTPLGPELWEAAQGGTKR